jgi:cysteine desulfurase
LSTYQRFYTKIKKVKGVKLNADKDNRYVGNVNISIKDVPSDDLVKEVRSIAMSNGAACLSDTRGIFAFWKILFWAMFCY